MSGVTHAAVGAGLGSTLNHPVSAFAVGAVSHLLLDALPHNEWFPIWLEVLSSVLALGLLGFFSPFASPGMFWGALGAVMPDVEIVILTLWHRRDPKREEAFFHRFVHQPPAHGVFSQSIQLGILLVASGVVAFLVLR